MLHNFVIYMTWTENCSCLSLYGAVHFVTYWKCPRSSRFFSE